MEEITKARETIDTRHITTKQDLIQSFREIGVKPGMCVMLHASMKSLGYVVNGPNDVIDALLETLTPEGTMLVSANSSQVTDPAEWKAPSIPEEWVDIARSHMRPFDKKTTLIRGRGIIPVAFMLYEGVERSDHPVKSIAAKGKLASDITGSHPLHESEGEGSPMHKLYLSKGYALMAGVDLVHCSALHLAEFLADVPYLYENNFRVLVPGADGKNQFVSLKKYPVTSKYFYKLQEPLLEKGYLLRRECRDTTFMLLDVYNSVNYAADLLKADNNFLLHA